MASNAPERLLALHEQMFSSLHLIKRRLGLVTSIGSRVDTLSGRAASTLQPCDQQQAPSVATCVRQEQLASLDNVMGGIMTELRDLTRICKQQEQLYRQLRSLQGASKGNKLRSASTGLEISVSDVASTAKMLHEYCTDLLKVVAHLTSSASYTSTSGAALAAQAAAFASLSDTVQSKLRDRMLLLY